MKPKPAGALVAVDGIGDRRLVAAARQELAVLPRARRGGVSVWDASGIFGDLVVAGPDAGRASARTLLMLYAADLAFRLRWEIRPILDEGRTVVAAPYVTTAVAFGRAAGLDEGWLTNLFLFAPAPARAVTLDAPKSDRQSGCVDFLCSQLADGPRGRTRRALREQVRAHLKRARRGRGA